MGLRKKEKRRLSDEELAVAFCTRKVWQRMIIVAAGPGINVFLAFTLLAGLFMIRGIPVNPPIIRGLAVGTASYDAGFRLGDRILEMDGRKIEDFNEIYKVTSEDWIKPHEYKVLRDGKEIMITMTSREVNHTDFKGRKIQDRGRTGMVNGVTTLFEYIIAVEGIDTKDNPDKVRDLIKKNFDKPILVEYDLTDEDRDIFLTYFPAQLNEHLNDPKHAHYDRAFMSDKDELEFKRDYLFAAYGRAADQIWRGIKTTVGLLAVINKGRTEEPIVGGILKLGKYAGGAAKEGISNYIVFLTMLSMAIALINVLPIPLLDGGFMVFLIYEAITGQQLSPRIQNIAFAIALVFLAGIMIIANLIDLIYFFS